MFYLTIGPMLNIFAYYFFTSKIEYINFNTMPSWHLSEWFELFGIVLLDISMIDDLNKNIILCFEIFGFINLCYASVLEFKWAKSLEAINVSLPSLVYKYIPYIKFSFYWIDISEFIGLVLLMAVSFHHYNTHGNH